MWRSKMAFTTGKLLIVCLLAALVAIAQVALIAWAASWTIVSSPNNGTLTNTLYSVAARNSTDAWAVGYYVPVAGKTNTLTQHWDGTSWSIVSSPSSTYTNTYLTGVGMV